MPYFYAAPAERPGILPEFAGNLLYNSSPMALPGMAASNLSNMTSQTRPVCFIFPVPNTKLFWLRSYF
jgi:hypothetical protein